MLRERDGQSAVRGDGIQSSGKTRNAELSERLDMYFGGTSWAIGAFLSLHGHEADPADLRAAVEQQLDKLKADVLSDVDAWFPPPANTEAVK